MKLFLDMDGTVTESRSRISLEMYEELSRFNDVVIVSGASKEQMRSQVLNLEWKIMAQNGNDTPLWTRHLYEHQKEEIQHHINQFAKIGNDQLEDRGCQISYSFVGHHAPLELKKQYDPTRERRLKILTDYPFQSETVEVKVAGTTCLDYYPKGHNKGTNIAEFIKQMGWDKDDCLYIGDALFPGGNDETVVGVIPTKSVKDPADTLAFLKTL